MVISVLIRLSVALTENFSVTQYARSRELGIFSFAEAGLSMVNPRVVS
jgi:hypothetical protein